MASWEEAVDEIRAELNSCKSMLQQLLDRFPSPSQEDGPVRNNSVHDKSKAPLNNSAAGGSEIRKMLKVGCQQSPANVVLDNDDLLSKVLMYLRVKQLVRLKLVSKQWNSLISDPRFCHQYSLVKLSYSPSALLISRGYREHELILAPLHDIPPDNDRIGVKLRYLSFIGGYSKTSRIIQTCNGLMLCCCYRARDIFVRDYFVCNFTTKQFNKLTIPVGSGQTDHHQMALAFDPERSAHYKVVFFCRENYFGNEHRPRIKIYSSETGTWKLAKDSQHDTLCWNEMGEKGVFWNNAIYWFGVNSCCYFDMNEERMRTAEVGSHYDHFGVSNGHLYRITEQLCGRGMKVYGMKRDQADHLKWRREHSIDLTPLINTFPDIDLNYGFDVLAAVWGGETAGLSVVILTNGKVIVFNQKDKTSKLLFRLPGNIHPSTTCMWDVSDQHFDTLFHV